MNALEGTNVLVLQALHIGRRREEHEILRSSRLVSSACESDS